MKNVDEFPALLSIVLSNGIEVEALKANGRKNIYSLFAGRVENPSRDIAFDWRGANQTVQGINTLIRLF